MEQRAKMHPGKVHGVAGRPSQWHGTNIIFSFSTFIPFLYMYFVLLFVFVFVFVIVAVSVYFLTIASWSS